MKDTGSNSYRFKSTWRVEGSVQAVFDGLERLDRYPDWWREVRSVTRLDQKRAKVRIKALLPYSLDLVLTRTRADIVDGILEVTMTGDLAGWSRWQITREEGTLRLDFEEVAELMKPSLRRYGALARPVFAFNHWVMMVRGQRGLRRYLRSSRPEASDTPSASARPPSPK